VSFESSFFKEILGRTFAPTAKNKKGAQSRWPYQNGPDSAAPSLYFSLF